MTYEEHETPITKTYTEIQPGDIFRTEYGTCDNFVGIIFESNEIKYEGNSPTWLKTNGHYKDGKLFVSYSPIYNKHVPTYEVIGKENRNDS